MVFVILVFSFAESYCGRNTAAFPEVSTASSAGISGACSAKQSDINALTYNPAAIYGIHNVTAMFTYDNNSLINSSSTLTTIVIPGQNDCTFALSYVFDRQSGVTDAPYGASDLSRYNRIVTAAYAFSAAENIKLGAAVKYLDSTIVSNKTSYMAFDAGAVFTGDFGLTSSVSILNLGDQFLYTDPLSLLSHEILPLKLGVGLNYDLPIDNINSISFSADCFYHVNESRYAAAIGMEYVFQNMITARFGDNVDAKGLDFISWGAGFNYDFYGIKTRLDYAYSVKISGTGDNGASNLLSILVFF
jgi:hypothetical protein